MSKPKLTLEQINALKAKLLQRFIADKKNKQVGFGYADDKSINQAYLRSVDDSDVDEFEPIAGQHFTWLNKPFFIAVRRSGTTYTKRYPNGHTEQMERNSHNISFVLATDTESDDCFADASMTA